MYIGDVESAFYMGEVPDTKFFIEQLIGALILVLYMNTFIVAGIIINLKKIKKRKI
jgi:hypothetical protein